MSLSKRAQQFQDVLDQRSLGLRVIELPDSTRTADDAARALLEGADRQVAGLPRHRY